jgi:hypothetical protein
MQKTLGREILKTKSNMGLRNREKLRKTERSREQQRETERNSGRERELMLNAPFEEIYKKYFLFYRFGVQDPNYHEFTLAKSYVFVSSVLTTARPWDVSPTTTAARISFLRFGYS